MAWLGGGGIMMILRGNIERSEISEKVDWVWVGYARGMEIGNMMVFLKRCMKLGGSGVEVVGRVRWCTRQRFQ